MLTSIKSSIYEFININFNLFFEQNIFFKIIPNKIF